MMTRNAEIFENFLVVIDRHLEDVLDGTADKMFELQDIAERLFIHPTHLSNVIKEHTSKHPCYFYEEKILVIAKNLLADQRNSIADVAHKLTYDPSNFTKWFKTYGKMSPSAYRKQLIAQAQVQPTMVTAIAS